jgi:gluconolactonase
MDGFEIADERFRQYVLPNAPLEKLADGFRWLEGPVWFADQQCLLVSDIPNDRIMRWTESGGVSVFRQPSGFANGQTRDRQGRLIGCSHQHAAITRTELDGTITVLASHYEGKRLNGPNDVVVKSEGTIWFTDPHYGLQTDYEGGRRTPELPPCVYRLDPEISILQQVGGTFAGPNGLCFSPDEQTLYIVDSGENFVAEPDHHILAFAVRDAELARRHIFHTVSPGHADGIRCDEHGNVWSAAADGVHCIDPAGKLLGKVLVPFPVANLAFGDRNYSRLFICGSQTLYAIFLNVRGAQRP